MRPRNRSTPIVGKQGAIGGQSQENSAAMGDRSQRKLATCCEGVAKWRFPAVSPAKNDGARTDLAVLAHRLR